MSSIPLSGMSSVLLSGMSSIRLSGLSSIPLSRGKVIVAWHRNGRVKMDGILL
jgi:hypothetical protein